MLPTHVASGLQLQGQFLDLTSHLELNLARTMRGNKKGFYKYICCKRKPKEGVGPVLNVRGRGAGVVTEDIGKTKELDACFTSVFTGKFCFREIHPPKHSGNVWSNEDLRLAEDNQVREHIKYWIYPTLVGCSHEC